MRQRIVLALLVLFAISAVAHPYAQQIGAADLLRGLATPSRWLMHSGDYASKRHSPLTQITPENVARLTPLWTFEAGLGFGRRASSKRRPSPSTAPCTSPASTTTRGRSMAAPAR